MQDQDMGKPRTHHESVLNELSIAGKPLSELFRMVAILVLLAPFGVLLYFLHENGSLSTLLEEKNILIFGLAVIIVLAVLAILQGIFNKLSALSAMMSRAAVSDASVHEFTEGTQELQEISRAFRSLLGRYDETSKELTRLSQLFISMKELSEAAARKLEMPELLSMLLDRALQNTGAQVGSVLLVGQGGGSVVVLKSYGVNLGDEEISIENSQLVYVLQNRKPLLVTDGKSDPLIHRHYNAKYGTPSFLAMPILLDDVLLGILNLAHRKSGTLFSDADVDTLTTMINQVHFALENAYIHETVKKHVRHLDEKTTQLKQEIAKRREVEVELESLALHDKLTGLANRHQFTGLLDQAVAQARRNKHKLAVLFVDMDRFKVINDSMGHDVGDLMLQETAQRMRSCLREEDIVARYGGDEFTCVLLDVHNEEDVEKVVDKLIDVLSKPYVLLGHEYFIGSSIGISLYPDNGEDSKELVKNADAAMYSVKESSGHSHCFFTPEIGKLVSQRVQLEIDLRHAVNRDEFVLYYQPQVDLRSGHLSGIEALLRWNHPEHGLLNPDAFIPLAEQTGLIVPIGRWVMEHACRQYKQWRDQGLVPPNTSLNAAVNISGQQFRQGDFTRMVAEVLKETGLEPHSLELEITESVIMDAADTAVEVLQEIKEMGVQLAIDDFGNGFSSLGYLKHFPIDTLKIDKVFTRHLPGDRNDAAIVHAILSLAYSLGMRVVAEGVENVEQLYFLRKNGCHNAQGYLLGRPVEAEEMLKMIRDEEIQNSWRELLGGGTVSKKPAD